ncbi:MAG: hypothetical protein II221_03180 [Paludibacteraceae bacterium]|nr:hypothetical protein [Paludibacteraceae bacterium]
MEKKQITETMKQALGRALPAEAIKPHPTKNYLSTINAIYVSERLNEVFGVGEWQTKVEYVSEKTNKTTMVVVKLTLDIPAYGIHYECFGGNDNADFGDAYKGATTDALTKIGSWLGIGAHVWKNDPTGSKTAAKPAPAPQPKPQQQITQQQAAKIAWDYLESNDKALNYYLQLQKVSDIADLDLIKVYNNLKSNNKI